MLKSFCDVCGKDANDGVPHRHESLSGTNSKRVGLEFIPLVEGRPAQDFHICGDCVLNLVWEMARQQPATGLAEKINTLNKQMEIAAQITVREGVMVAAGLKIEQRERAAEAFMAKLSLEKAAVDQKIPDLTQQIKALKAEQNEKIQQAVNEARVAWAQANKHVADALDKRAADLTTNEMSLAARMRMLENLKADVERMQAKGTASEAEVTHKVKDALRQQAAEYAAKLADAEQRLGAANARLQNMRTDANERARLAAIAERKAVQEAVSRQIAKNAEKEDELRRFEASLNRKASEMSERDKKIEANLRVAEDSVAELVRQHKAQVTGLEDTINSLRTETEIRERNAAEIERAAANEALRQKTENANRRLVDLDKRAVEAAKIQADLTKQKAEVANRLANFDRQVKEEAAQQTERQTAALRQQIEALKEGNERHKSDMAIVARTAAERERSSLLAAHQDKIDKLERRQTELQDAEARVALRNAELLKAEARADLAVKTVQEDILKLRNEHNAKVDRLTRDLQVARSETKYAAEAAAQAERKAILEADKLKTDAQDRREAVLSRLQEDLNRKAADFGKAEAALIKREADLKEITGASLADIAAKQNERVALLQAQVEHYKRVADTATKQAQAQSRQAAQEDPEYVARVARRAEIRGG